MREVKVLYERSDKMNEDWVFGILFWGELYSRYYCIILVNVRILSFRFKVEYFGFTCLNINDFDLFCYV